MRDDAASPTAMAYRVCLELMRDRRLHPDLRMDAAHCALFLEHLDADARADLDARALLGFVRTNRSEVGHGLKH